MSFGRYFKVVFCISPKRAMAYRKLFIVFFVVAVLLIACFMINSARLGSDTPAHFNQKDTHRDTEVSNDKSGNDKFEGDPLVKVVSAVVAKQTSTDAESNLDHSQRQELENQEFQNEQLRQQQELFDKQNSLMQQLQKQHQQRERELQQEIQQLQLQIRQLQLQLLKNPIANPKDAPVVEEERSVNKLSQNSNVQSRPFIFPVDNNGLQPAAQVINAQNNRPPQPNGIAKEQPELRNGLHPDVNIVPSFPPSGLVLPYKDCVPLPRFPSPRIKICIHRTSEDKYVSGSIKNNQLWEEALIFDMQKAFEADNSLMLLDLGCNIGEYTLWAAGYGREVLAVEMLMTNVELIQTSLQLSRLTSRVTIVNNAVYSDHRSLPVNFMSHNIGGSRLNTSKYHEELDTNKEPVLVKTICLDDLSPLLVGKSVFIKMDIENSEHHALACAHRLFTEANIKIVQMEWMNKSPDEESQILRFMKTHGYVVSRSPLEYQRLLNLGGDLYFLKKSSFNIR